MAKKKSTVKVNDPNPGSENWLNSRETSSPADSWLASQSNRLATEQAVIRDAELRAAALQDAARANTPPRPIDPNRFSNAPNDWRVRNQSPGIAGLWEGLTGSVSDFGRGLYNGISDITDFLSSRAPGTTRIGSDSFGPDAGESPYSSSSSSSLANPSSAGNNSNYGTGAGGALIGGGVKRPSPMLGPDYVALANAMGLGATTDYSALKNQLQANATSSDAQIGAMYDALRASIEADAAGIGQSYDTTQQALQQIAADSTAQTNAAYQAARDAQTQQFQQLGIQDAAGVLAAAGNAAGADQAHALGNIAQTGAANQSQNAQHRASALNYNTNIGNAAGFEGTVQRAAIQKQLANKLAELQVAQSQEEAQGAKSAFDAASQMAQNPALWDPNYQGNPMDSLQAQLLAGQVTAQDLKNQALAANSLPLSANLTQYQTLFQTVGPNFGLDPANKDDFVEFIKLMKEMQALGGA